MIYFPLLSRETLQLQRCCVDLRNILYYHTIKSVDARYFCSVERLLYALGAGWQGRVKLEVQNQTHSPCIGTLSFCPDTTAHQTCAGRYQMYFIVF